MDVLFAWLKAGAPPHYAFLAMCGYMLITEVLAKVHKVKANTALEAIFHLVLPILKSAASPFLPKSEDKGPPNGTP